MFAKSKALFNLETFKVLGIGPWI